MASVVHHGMREKSQVSIPSDVPFVCNNCKTIARTTDDEPFARQVFGNAEQGTFDGWEINCPYCNSVVFILDILVHLGEITDAEKIREARLQLDLQFMALETEFAELKERQMQFLGEAAIEDAIDKQLQQLRKYHEDYIHEQVERLQAHCPHVTTQLDEFQGKTTIKCVICGDVLEHTESEGEAQQEG